MITAYFVAAAAAAACGSCFSCCCWSAACAVTAWVFAAIPAAQPAGSSLSQCGAPFPTNGMPRTRPLPNSKSISRNHPVVRVCPNRSVLPYSNVDAHAITQAPSWVTHSLLG